MSFTLPRRVVLRGLGGATLAVPTLEAMLDRNGAAYAQTGAPIPKRYLVCFCGTSMGADNDPLHNDYVPSTAGRNYDLKTALAPLGALKDEVSVVSGISIPTANGGAVPPGGRRDDFHVSSLSPLLSGVRSPDNTSSAGPTSDFFMQEILAGDTPFKSLHYRVQAAWYLSVSAPYGRDMISYKRDTTNRVVAVPPTTSPQQAYNALFGNFAPPDDTAERNRLAFRQKARRSVLDLVHGNIVRLMPRLGAADRQRLQRHLDEVRALELRIAAIPPPAGGICQKPAAPGADPTVGNPQGTNAAGENTYATNLGYSDEETRARVFTDLVHMAMACDLTRVATLQYTMFQSHLNMYPLTGHACDLHEIGHNGDPKRRGTKEVSAAIAWHVKHWAALLQKFKDTAEGGADMLANMAIMFVNEGGHGKDTATGEMNSGHSTENMACMIAGRAGGLRPGKHVVATGKHPANVILSAMTALGYTGAALGEVSGTIPELFTA